MKPSVTIFTAVLVLLGGCGGSATSNATTVPVASASNAPPSSCSGSTAAGVGDGTPPVSAPFGVPSGFVATRIAGVGGARELAALPNGDLLVGTAGTTIEIVPNAEAATTTGAPRVFATMPDAPAAGVAFDAASCTIVVGTQFGVYTIPYVDGDTQARGITKIASVRTHGSGAHTTTSVAVSDGTIYASVGSSCNACVESDPTRARILAMGLDGSNVTTKATRIRNAIALAIDPASGALWAGDAGQDGLPQPHPYEFIDDVSAHSGSADYGWPDCEENHVAYTAGADCSATVVPLVEASAYATTIGLAFYPGAQGGAHAFPSAYRGGLFATHHGSWHTLTSTGCNVAPDIIFIPMNGDAPKSAVDWSDPTTQWSTFGSGFQPGCAASTRIGRPTGIAVGSQGSLFVADDDVGAIYRIRPATAP